MRTDPNLAPGALEENNLRSGLTTAWGGRDAIEAGRRKAERAAFDKLLPVSDPSGGEFISGMIKEFVLIRPFWTNNLFSLQTLQLLIPNAFLYKIATG